MIRLTISFALCFLFSFSLFAQDKYNIEHTIQSEVFGKERKITVTLPDRYFNRDSTNSFSVTYVLDAQYKPFWDMAKANISYMTDSYNVIPMITVGIHSDNRGSEFSPPATQLQEHIEKEVFPLIEKHYRVTSFTTLVGHSWAGQFIGSTLFGEKTDMFDNYIAISPVFGYKDNLVLNQADSVFKTKPTFRKFLYCSTGNVGTREAEFSKGVAILDSLVKHYNNETFGWASTIFDGRGHWSCVIPSISEGLLLMSRNYWADVKIMEDFAKNGKGSIRKQVKAFKKTQHEKFGFSYASEAHYIKFTAEDFSEQGMKEAATELFKWSLELDPKAWRTHSALAWHYEQDKKYKLALKSYKNTYKVWKSIKDTLEEEFYLNYEKWLVKKIDELKEK